MSLARFIPGLRERDGDGCQLCYEPIDFSLRNPDPMSRTVDHVRPRIAGGRDVLPNLRLAHARCNNKRGCAWDGWLYDNPHSACAKKARGQRYRDINWDDRMSARQPAGGRVLYLGEEPSLPCA